MQVKSEVLPPSSSFCHDIYSEIEEVGWEHLVSLDRDLTSVIFNVVDKKGQAHILEIPLPRNYPEGTPSFIADVPYVPDLQWSMSSRLRDVVLQFEQHLEKLQELWSTLDEIDKNLWVIEPQHRTRATLFREISLGNECYLLLSVNARNPRSLPECRLFGPDSKINPLKQNWRCNCKMWRNDKSYPENLESILETVLPRPPDEIKDSQCVDCGICYACYLPDGNECGEGRGIAPDYTCDNQNCSRLFHSICLRDWLRSITTTRQSFDVLFGNCPYCSEPVAVKVDSSE